MIGKEDALEWLEKMTRKAEMNFQYAIMREDTEAANNLMAELEILGYLEGITERS